MKKIGYYIKNYAYYYKPQIIGVCILLFFILFTLYNCIGITKPKDIDLNFVIAQHRSVSTSDAERLKKAFAFYTPDVNGDGKAITDYEAYSLALHNNAPDPKASFNNQMVTIFKSKRSVLFILDKATFDEYSKLGVFADLSLMYEKLNKDEPIYGLPLESLDINNIKGMDRMDSGYYIALLAFDADSAL